MNPDLMSVPTQEIVEFLQQLVAIPSFESEKAIAKINVPFVASGAGSVGNIIHGLGIPIVNAYGCRSGNVHAPNEWLDLTTIEPVFRIYFESLWQWMSQSFA